MDLYLCGLRVPGIFHPPGNDWRRQLQFFVRLPWHWGGIGSVVEVELLLIYWGRGK
jgi:hypothetical protein